MKIIKLTGFILILTICKLSEGKRNNWSSEEDRRWRATTKAPYFENKVPGSESYLPAAAVVGAATAFGLTSLLPLNVPANRPLMYCNNIDIAQIQIKLDDTTYSCVNRSITMSCPNYSGTDGCLDQTVECGHNYEWKFVYCMNGTLLSNSNLVCNSTTILSGTNVNETTTILNCYPGMVAEKLASFIPTTTTEAPITTTTEKQLSFGASLHGFFLKLAGKEEDFERLATATTEKQLSLGARIHILFLKLAGKEEVLERPISTTTEDPRIGLKENEIAWVPKALTIPPEPWLPEVLTIPSKLRITTPKPTTTTEDPFYLAWKMPRELSNGTFVFEDEKIDDYLAETILSANKIFGGSLPDVIYKIPITTEKFSSKDLNSIFETSSPSTVTVESSTSITSSLSNRTESSKTKDMIQILSKISKEDYDDYN